MRLCQERFIRLVHIIPASVVELQLADLTKGHTLLECSVAYFVSEVVMLLLPVTFFAVNDVNENSKLLD